MAELTIARLRRMASVQSNRAAQAERQVRDLTVENQRLRRENAALRSAPPFTEGARK